jgi:hypothetical protein
MIGLTADDFLVQFPLVADIARRHRPVERTAPQSAAIVIWHRMEASAAASFNHGYHSSPQKGRKVTPHAPRAPCPRRSPHLARSVRVRGKCDEQRQSPQVSLGNDRLTWSHVLRSSRSMCADRATVERSLTNGQTRPVVRSVARPSPKKGAGWGVLPGFSAYAVRASPESDGLRSVRAPRRLAIAGRA